MNKKKTKRVIREELTAEDITLLRKLIRAELAVIYRDIYNKRQIWI